MLRQILACAGLAALQAMTGFVVEAQESAAAIQETPPPRAQTVELPGVASKIHIGIAAIEPGSARINPELLTAIVAWLSGNYDLPALYDPPSIEFMPARAMAALQQSNTRSETRSSREASMEQAGTSRDSSEIVATYDDADRTIHLPRGWSGRTPLELSILVHEMVHHLQNLAEMKFACPQAREKLAYAVQQDWLALFGRDFFSDFETDPMTLLVRTECGY